MCWYPAYIGLGSNLDGPQRQVQSACRRLGTFPDTRLVRCSSLYGSTPMGPIAQPDFVNAVAALLTQLDARQLFEQLRGLEAALGRDAHAEHWGPRRIDLDLLAYAQQRVDTPQLQVPHPGIAQRNFVLYPLLEVAPELELPGLGRVAQLAAAVTPAGIWRLTDEAGTRGA